ncbi:TPA: DUF6500 family protein [Raoultella planticola]
MRACIRERIARVCGARIAARREHVGVSFYAFFSNSNDDPELLMEVAHWWILEMKLDHFEKAKKILALVAPSTQTQATRGNSDTHQELF